jgi:hypothetical protein
MWVDQPIWDGQIKMLLSYPEMFSFLALLQNCENRVLVEHSLFEMLGTGSISDFGLFSDFEILAYYSELDLGWEPNLNAKSIYVLYTAYEYIGFI